MTKEKYDELNNQFSDIYTKFNSWHLILKYFFLVYYFFVIICKNKIKFIFQEK